MATLTNTYRRNTKWVMGLFALLIALMLNVDALEISGSFYDNVRYREAAVAFASQDCDAEGNCLEDAVAALDQLSDLGIPILGEYRNPWSQFFGVGENWFLHGLGLLITAVLAGFGGPFWWDFLRFLTGVRRKK
jgi:hypothetical protein